MVRCHESSHQGSGGRDHVRPRGRRRRSGAHLGPAMVLCRSITRQDRSPTRPRRATHLVSSVTPEESNMVTPCVDIAEIAEVKPPRVRVCEDCVAIGGQWVHLRTCQTCGATLCCDSSPNRHASRHAHSANHPVIASAEPGERWLYCYVDEVFAEYLSVSGSLGLSLTAQGRAWSPRARFADPGCGSGRFKKSRFSPLAP